MQLLCLTDGDHSESLPGLELLPHNCSTSPLGVRVPSSAAERFDLVLVDAGLVTSLSEARRAIKQGGVYVNNAQVQAEDAALTAGDLLHGRFAVLRRGKKTLAGVRV